MCSKGILQNKEPTNETLLSINNRFDTTKRKRVAVGKGKILGMENSRRLKWRCSKDRAKDKKVTAGLHGKGEGADWIDEWGERRDELMSNRKFYFLHLKSFLSDGSLRPQPPLFRHPTDDACKFETVSSTHER